LVLVGIVVFGVVEFRFKSQYNAAVNALSDRAGEEDKDLMTEGEANTILGRQPDGPGVDVGEFGATLTRKTYSWPSLLGRRTLTAYYTKQKEPRLHHYETAAAKPAVAPASSTKKLTPPPKSTSRKSSKGGGLAPDGVVDD
jgi:hypothetical protein